VLRAERQADGRFQVTTPVLAYQHHDIVYAGEVMAQTVIAVHAASQEVSRVESPGASRAGSDGTKYLKTVNSMFVRAGSHATPIDFDVQPVQRGRTWESWVVTGWQNGAALTTATALLTADEPDFIAHAPRRPADIALPEDLDPASRGVVFPGAELRPVPGWPGDEATGDVPRRAFWTRMPGIDDPHASQAVVAWAANGTLMELAMQPHHDVVDMSMAHRSVSAAIMALNLSFQREVDASQWLLFVLEATSAGRGRVHGGGRVFDESGVLVATYSQEGMIKPMNPDRPGSI
jgi:acyl-CoA thioesterase